MRDSTADLKPMPEGSDSVRGPAGAHKRRLAVIGGGWAGLSAAVRGCEAGMDVTLFEMAPSLGGRAKSHHPLLAPGDDTREGEVAQSRSESPLDNGQHILIGAYRSTLALMRTVGVIPEQVLWRSPLRLAGPDGLGFRLGRGPAALAFLLACMCHRQWSLAHRVSFLGWAALQSLRSFRCAPELTVHELCVRLPGPVRKELIDPLCVSALNTPAERASANVFLRVLHDTLTFGTGASDLLIARIPLQQLLPEPALAWLKAKGARILTGHRVQAIERAGCGNRWHVAGEDFDAVIVATSSTEAARLIAPWNPAWTAQARSLAFEPIITAHVQTRGPAGELPFPMLMLPHDERRLPCQFLFDHGALSGQPGRYTAVVSAAGPWVERGADATRSAIASQLTSQLPQIFTADELDCRLVIEKRATFACTPALVRPSAEILPGLWAAADFVEGPYPATLEGAVLSGQFAAECANRQH